MTFYRLFLSVVMLSLCSGLFLLGQAKRKSHSAAASRSKYKKRCKPFSYALVFIVFNGRHAFAALRFVSFLSREKKEPLGGGEPRQDRAKGRECTINLT